MALNASLQFRCEPLDRQQIGNRLKGCPSLPSLRSIDTALKELLTADQRYTSQIADIIRRDPSLTSRVLRLVNSVYYGISSPVKSIEEAVFYLGVRQIRQLALATPVIEDLQKLAGGQGLSWREFWRHCIGVAMMTREVSDLVQSSGEEAEYVAGLIHDVGKIAMAAAFPEHFGEICARLVGSRRDLPEVEREVLGLDHAELGALYLSRQSVPEVFVEIVQFHHTPDQAPKYSREAAAVQVADYLVRQARIGESGNHAEITDEVCMRSSGWQLLFARQSSDEMAATAANLKKGLERMPQLLESLL